VYTFHLRDNLKWSDGTPVVAQDYVNGLIRTVDPATASDKAYYFSSTIQVTNAGAFTNGDVQDPAQVGFAAPDERTVVITLDNPAPHTLWILTSFQSSPLHKPSFEQYGTDFVQAGKLVGNGPYILNELVPQSHLVLTKNPHYWDAANVPIDEVWYHVTEDMSAATKRYLAGELDLTVDAVPDEIEKLVADGKLKAAEYHVAPNVDSYYFSFNITKKPFDDIRVRQALSMAIDRDALQNKILKSGFPVAYSIVPLGLDPNYPGAALKEKDMSMADRIATAQKLMADAGYGADNPLKLVLLSTNDNDEKKEAVAVSIMWKKALGVECELVNQEYQAWLDSFYAGNWDVFNDNLVGDFAGAETYLSYMTPSADAGYNWKNDEYEGLMGQAAATADVAARNKILAEAEQVLLDDYLIAPISGGATRQLVRLYVKGWIDNVVQFHATRFLRVEKA
jgi:oligopeptide transport system substrate-binding protein